MQKKECRLCGQTGFVKYLKLGSTPLANSYLLSPTQMEKCYDLSVNFCVNCGHSQLSEVVPPEEMYTNYLYASSTPKLFNQHCEILVSRYWEVLKLNFEDLIVDIASNDGCLLSKFKLQEFNNIIGVEPAKNLAKLAIKRGINTIVDFFTPLVARDIVSKYNQKAKLIVAQNVFAHIDDLHKFMKGIDNLLHDDGLFVIEFPYAKEMYERNAFDTIYHEHLSYFLIAPLKRFFSSIKYSIVNVEYFDKIHGGTVRLSVCKEENVTKFKDVLKDNVDDYVSAEIANQYLSISVYNKFSENIQFNSKSFKSLIKELVNKNKRIGWFGASAKGNTFLNFCYPQPSIETTSLVNCYDENPLKWDHYLPGSRLKINSVLQIERDKIDYLIISTWNFQEEIIERCRDRYNFKGSFIIPIPFLKIR